MIAPCGLPGPGWLVGWPLAQKELGADDAGTRGFYAAGS